MTQIGAVGLERKRHLGTVRGAERAALDGRGPVEPVSEHLGMRRLGLGDGDGPKTTSVRTAPASSKLERGNKGVACLSGAPGSLVGIRNDRGRRALDDNTTP